MSKPTDAVERAKAFAQRHPKMTRIECGSGREFDHWIVIMADHAAAELAAYRERLRAAVDELSLVDNHAGCYNDAVADVLELIGEMK